MRTARPVGLSQDGRSLIVATASGEELAIPVDDRLHATLRGDRPRLGQLEIEMENALGPRDIQSRIRAGESLEDVGRVAGIPLDRVERFAAPVLAEREHVALLAMSSSVRRKSETAGHRLLRVALNERLQKRGVDVDTVDWDSYRLEDGRWSVSAEYRSGESTRRAIFLFDLQGRFSVAGNDEARWMLGEQSPTRGPQPGRQRPEQGGESGPDTEPTLDLSDELALVRAIQPAVHGTHAAEVESSAEEESWVQASRRAGTWAEQQDLHPVADDPVADELDADESEVVRSDVDESDGVDLGGVDLGGVDLGGVDLDDDDLGGDEPGGDQSDGDLGTAEQGGRLATVSDLHAIPERVRSGDRFAQQPSHEEVPSSDDGEESALDILHSIMESGEQDPPPSYGGLSDASAVPETDLRGWEPGIVVDYPVEPSPEEHDEQPREDPLADGSVSRASVFDDVHRTDSAERNKTAAADPAGRVRTTGGTDQPAPPDPVVEGQDRADEAAALEEEHEAAKPAPKPAGKRKRAAVPSWDEIMFGGPSRSS